jgi:peptidylprolyl isomerase
VSGMGVGEERRVNIPSEQAYGARRDDLTVAVGRTEFPEGVDPEVGQQLEMRQGAQRMVVRVAEITEENVTLDANHPLAGQDLTFDLELVEIV